MSQQDERVLANGAVGRYFLNAEGKRVFRFVSGANKSYLDSIRVRGSRGPNTRPSSRKPSMRFLMRALKEARGFGADPDTKRVHYRIAQDMGRASRKVLDLNNPAHCRLARKEGALLRWDVQGLDHGNKNPGGRKGFRLTKPNPKNPIRLYPVAPRSQDQLAASRANIRLAQAARRM